MAEMIVEAFLSSLFDVVLERLASRNFIDYFRRVNLDTLIDKLESILNSINHVLDDAEMKQYENADVKIWLSDVKHALYEADQLLDEIATDSPVKKLKAECQPSTSNIFNFIPTFSNPFESRIKDLTKVLDSLAKDKDILELKKGMRARNDIGVGSKRSERLPTSYLVDASNIIGRDNDKDEMIKVLVSNNDIGGNQTPIISIVGLGGMGKTTFAKLVYNDNKIDEYFDLKAWVYVSESFEVVGLTKEILKSFNSSADNESNFNLLQQQLQKRLSGKKYLLVLDDIWNGNEEIWEQLLLPFNHGSFGSKIIVTTRDKEVASILNSKLFNLKQLDKSDCWSLFVTRAFHGKNVFDYPNLEAIGKKIVDKCGGLPLAVKTLGQLLRKKFSQQEWVKILETDMWRLSDGGNNINPVLRLSYHNLPSNRKRCFAYCSIFPKGNWFEKSRLIKLWMAEGLLKCCGTDKSEEELGNDIFGDLESISFFQKPLYPILGRYVHHFVMHDLVSDLAKSVSGEFCMQIKASKVEVILERTRHIWCSLQSNCVDKLQESICELKGLRSLILQGMLISINVQHDLFSRLKNLRMLSFRYCDLSELVDAISNLKLLRYLDLSHTKITSLPDTICMLHNLQTLLLKCCELTELPSNFAKLINLRHLELPCDDNAYPCIKKMPYNVGKLVNLQTLPYFITEDENGFDIKELAKLNHLHGTIHIFGLGNVIDPADAAKANLKDKKYLEELCMDFSDTREEMDDSTIVSVLEALEPNSNLRRLTIEYYQGNWFPYWLKGCHLPNLVSLKLHGCESCFWMPPLGQLPSLKELSILGCDGIMIISEEFYGNNSSNVSFRYLEVLEFGEMYQWEEWVCLESFPLLRELCIRKCPKLKSSLPQHLPSLQKLVINDCKELEVSIPKTDNIRELELTGCDTTFVNELPSSLKGLVLGNLLTKLSLEKNLLNKVILEELDVEFGDFVECPSLDFCCYNSLHKLSIRRGHFPSIRLHMFANLGSLRLYNCLELRSFYGGGLPSSLSSLEIHNCPKLIASRAEWGLFQLNSLKYLSVSDDFENVESFPEENLLPPSLERLTFTDCLKLRKINLRGLLHLTSLRNLHIEYCRRLKRFPKVGLPFSISYLQNSNETFEIFP